MSGLNQRSRREVLQTFLSGQDGSVEPELLSENSYRFGLNITSRRGLPSTRPPLINQEISLASGKFQGAKLYRLNSGDRFIFAIAGKVYSLDLDTGTVTEKVNPRNSFQADVDRFYFMKANKYFIAQDGYKPTKWADANWPLILDGDTIIDQSTATPAIPESQQFPKGAAMAYGQGRAHVVTAWPWTGAAFIDDLGNVGFVSGNIYKSWRPEDVLKFTEEDYLNEGGRHELAEELGFINILAFQKNVMPGTAQGPLIAIAQNGASAFQINASRSVWKDIDMSFVLFSDVTTRGNYSAVTYNSDIFFRAGDGIRTLTQTIAQQQSAGLVTIPRSTEVDDILAEDDLDSLNRVSAAKLGQKLYFTAKPSGNEFDALVSLDMSPISTFKESLPAMYDGVWTGLKFSQILSGVKDNKEYLYAFAKDTSDNNVLYRFDSGSLDQSAASPLTTSQTVCRIYTRGLQFEDGLRDKRLRYAEVYFSDVTSNLDVTMYYKTDKYPLWVQMQSGQFLVSAGSLPVSFGKIRINLSEDDDDDDSIHHQVTDTKLSVGTIFEFCIEWKGSARLDKTEIIADLVADDKTEPDLVETARTTVSIAADGTQIAINDYSYRIG